MEALREYMKKGLGQHILQKSAERGLDHATTERIIRWLSNKPIVPKYLFWYKQFNEDPSFIRRDKGVAGEVQYSRGGKVVGHGSVIKSFLEYDYSKHGEEVNLDEWRRECRLPLYGLPLPKDKEQGKGTLMREDMEQKYEKILAERKDYTY